MHVLSLSNRFYYKEFDPLVEQYIKKDLELYSSMVRTSFKKIYDKSVKGVGYPLLNGKEKSLQSMIKEQYGTSDYLPLSAINEAKAMYHARVEHTQHLKKMYASRIKKIEDKISCTNKKLKSCIKKKNRLIVKSKKKQYTESDYLYETQKLDPMIRSLKSRIGLLTFRKNRFQDKILKIKNKIPSIHFKKRNRMLIPGRRQGKYSNNLFKLDIYTDEILIRTHSGNITLPVTFHKNKDILYEKVSLPHNTPQKAVAYELKDHGEYFIVKAIMEIGEPKCISYKANGCISLDTNVDHFALMELDHYGNIVGTKILPFQWKNRSTNQRKHDIRECAKEIVTRCVNTNKPLIIEDLDFTGKKNKMLYGNKRKNEALSSFAYAHITEILERRAMVDGIECIKVAPSYTTQIGKQKYKKLKGLSVHLSASLVIGRRGLGYSDRLN